MDNYGLSSKNAKMFIKQLTGPKVDSSNRNYTRYQWYKRLEWGDTASIYIDIYKTMTTFSWRDKYFWNKVTMNYQWDYLFKAKSKFVDIIPHKIQHCDTSILYLSSEQGRYNTLLKADLLLFYLKKGYFEVLKQEKNYTIILFYQPIAFIDKDTTMCAKVLFNSHQEIVIIPQSWSFTE